MGAFAYGTAILGVLSLVGCASTQLNNNTLDLAKKTDNLLGAQVMQNLAQYIDSDGAIPGQIDISGGSANTINQVQPSFTDPITDTVSVGRSVVKGAMGLLSRTKDRTSTDPSSTFAINLSNTAQQSWSYSPISDPDQLRRLDDLYRFAVLGNDKLDAQRMLAMDYPLAYFQAPDGTPKLDPRGINGSNCVICACSGKPNAYSRTLMAGDRQYMRPFIANSSKESQLCVVINPRLLPHNGFGRWLLWKSLPGAGRHDSIPAPSPDDNFIGRYGHYLLYVDRDQMWMFSQFQLFIAVAARSAPAVPPPSPGGPGASPGLTTTFALP
jgi:hypothetical protein